MDYFFTKSRLLTRLSPLAFLLALPLAGLSGVSHAISVGINPVTTQKNCALNVSGVVAFTHELPATAVTIDFLPAGKPLVALTTNLPLQAGGKYQWTGPVPGYASIPAGARIKVTTNRQINASTVVPTCVAPTQTSILDFSTLKADGIAVESYAQGGFLLNGLMKASTYGLKPPALGVYPAGSLEKFTLKAQNNNSFNLASLMLRSHTDRLAPQKVVFTGVLASGGTVTHTVTTAMNNADYQTITFPASFTNLSSVYWTPGLTAVTNITVNQ